MSPNLPRGGHIDFGANRVGVGAGVGVGVGVVVGVGVGLTLSCLQSAVRFLPNFQGYIFETYQNFLVILT